MSKSLIFAHRGANREAAENTRTAFDKALAYPIDGIETDIQLSRDGVAVLWHDRFLDKLGCPAKHIDDFDYAQLQKIDFAAHFSPKAKSESLMTLREFLEAYSQRCRLLLEVKNRDWEARSRHEEKMRLTLDMVAEGDGEGVMVSSFNLDSLIYAHQYAPGFPLVYNIEPGHDPSDVQRILIGQSFLHGVCLSIGSLDQGTVKLLRDQGKHISVYTCNTDEEIDRALGFGVDILISDIPQHALQRRG